MDKEQRELEERRADRSAALRILQRNGWIGEEGPVSRMLVDMAAKVYQAGRTEGERNDAFLRRVMTAVQGSERTQAILDGYTLDDLEENIRRRKEEAAYFRKLAATPIQGLEIGGVLHDEL